MKAEQWKDISNYKGLYQVSSYGRIKSLPRKVRRLPTCEYYTAEKILKPLINRKNGYCYVTLSKNSVVRSKSVHRLVAIEFNPNPLKKKCINHNNGNKQDNHSTNLIWATHSENQEHAIRTGLAPKPPVNFNNCLKNKP